MSNYLAILKRALQDPVLEGIDGICPSEYDKLSEFLERASSDACVSEWRYGTGNARYECHVHTNGVASDLKKAFEDGARGGNPRLTAVHSKDELVKIIQESPVGSGCNQGN